MIDTHRTDLGAPFWQGLAAGRLMLQLDAATGRAQFYPRPQAPDGGAEVRWQQASGRGTILALTLSRVAPPQLVGAVPYALALVQLDEGPRLLARVAAAFESLAIGQSVEVDWNHPDTLAAFPVFKPAV